MATQEAMLVTRVGRMACGFRIADVIETMRPLPVEPIRAGAAALTLVEGLAMIRGAPVPVVDARRLLGVTGEPATRFVVLRAGERQVALAVDEVIDVKRIAADAVASLPPLLRGADSVSAVGALDAALLVVLDAARVLPDDAWRALAHTGLARHEPPGGSER